MGGVVKVIRVAIRVASSTAVGVAGSAVVGVAGGGL